MKEGTRRLDSVVAEAVSVVQRRIDLRKPFPCLEEQESTGDGKSMHGGAVIYNLYNRVTTSH